MTMTVDMQQHIALAIHRGEYEYADILSEGLCEPVLGDFSHLLGQTLPLLEGSHSAYPEQAKQGRN